MITADTPNVPYFLSSAPSDGAVQVKENSSITLNFSQPVNPGTGYIFISNGLKDLRSISVTDTQVRINPDNSSEVVIQPSAALLNNTAYYVQFADGVFTDTQGNPIKGINDTVSFDFKTAPADTSPPFPVYTSPGNHATAIHVNSSIEVEFDEFIQAGPGRFIISNDQGDTRFISAYDSTQVYNNGYSIFIKPTQKLSFNSNYLLQMQDAAVLDLNGNAVVGITNDQGLHFKTALKDTSPPIPIESSPSANAEQVPLNTSIYATFNEPINAVSGYITISNGQDDTQKISVTDTNYVRINYSKAANNNLTIFPPKPLQAGSSYFIQIDNGAIVDLEGNAYKGIQDHSFTFHTVLKDIVAPTLASLQVVLDSENFNGRIEFNEPIIPGSGNLVITDKQGYSMTIDIHDSAQVLFQGNNLIITPMGNFLPNTEYSVRIDKGAVTDSTGNPFTGTTDTNRLSFTTPPIDTTPPTPIMANVQDYQGYAYKLKPKITIRFNERVKAGPGHFIISNGQNDVRKIASSDSSQIRIGINDLYGKTPPDYTLLEMTPAEPLLEGSQYFVLMEAGAVTDRSDNAVNAVMDPQAFTFKTQLPDKFPPTIQFSYPSDDVFIPPYHNQFDISFTEDIKAGSGHILISNGRDDIRTFDVNNSSEISFEGYQLVIRTTKPFIADDTYFIQIEPDAITDLNGNAFTGITDPFRYNYFIKADTEAPQLFSSYPMSYNAIAPSSNIQFGFNEQIQIGSGNITLVNSQGDRQIFSVKDTTKVTLYNDFTIGNLTLNLANSVPTGKYAVLIDKGAVTDLAGNAFEGVNDNSRLVFTISPEIIPN